MVPLKFVILLALFIGFTVSAPLPATPESIIRHATIKFEVPSGYFQSVDGKKLFKFVGRELRGLFRAKDVIGDSRVYSK
uniref:Secreted protein n=1 Tax=Panagrellus redivivus TaxID=6233 RepID=A0A7E4UUG9_PANRE